MNKTQIMVNNLEAFWQLMLLFIKNICLVCTYWALVTLSHLPVLLEFGLWPPPLASLFLLCCLLACVYCLLQFDCWYWWYYFVREIIPSPVPSFSLSPALLC